MEADILTPAQRRTLDELLSSGQPRPTFPAELPLRLLDLLEAGLGPLADRLGEEVLTLNKTTLARVLACERNHVAEASQSFSWSPASARGTVVHRALQMAVFRPDGAAPLALVDDVIAGLVESGDDWSPRDFLRTATPQELGELRADAADVVTRFQECFPAPRPEWRPRMESPIRVELCAGRIVLRAKVDLSLGRPRGHEARQLLVDLKTGHPRPGHLDDLRFYALLETIRLGVPPFRVASYYLDAARWHAEDVTEDLLEGSARRVVAGATRLGELLLREREPAVTPGPACRWCPEQDRCDGARQWAALTGDGADPDTGWHSGR